MQAGSEGKNRRKNRCKGMEGTSEESDVIRESSSEGSSHNPIVIS